jgi:hypothetical protein
MSGAIPPLPNTPSWRGAHLKHSDNFTLSLPLVDMWTYNIITDTENTESQLEAN